MKEKITKENKKNFLVMEILYLICAALIFPLFILDYLLLCLKCKINPQETILIEAKEKYKEELIYIFYTFIILIFILSVPITIFLKLANFY